MMPSDCGLDFESNAGIQAGAGWRNLIFTANAEKVNGLNGTKSRLTRLSRGLLKLNFMIFIRLIDLRPERCVFPSATQSFDKLDCGNETLTGKLGFTALGLQRFAARVHDFEIAHNAGAVTICRQIGG